MEDSIIHHLPASCQFSVENICDWWGLSGNWIKKSKLCATIDYDNVPVRGRTSAKNHLLLRCVREVYPQWTIYRKIRHLDASQYAWARRRKEKSKPTWPWFLCHPPTQAAGTQLNVEENKLMWRLNRKHNRNTTKPWSCHKSSVYAVRIKSTSNLTASTTKTSGMPVIALDETTHLATLDAILSLVASLNALLTMNSSAYWRVCFSENHRTLQCNFTLENKRQVFTRFRDSNTKQLLAHTDCTNDQSGWRVFCKRNHSCRCNITRETKMSATGLGISFCPQQPTCESKKS